MKLECDDDGDLYIDPDFLSARLCVDSRELQRRMRMGLVTSLVEEGTGDDRGLRRVTVRNGGIAWQAIVDDANNVTSEALVSFR